MSAAVLFGNVQFAQKHPSVLIRLVDRAKLVLMECLKMSEESAHYYIEHQAMNMRCTKTEIAQSVIRTYKN